ncbi:uncharacterized protein [Haliotis asinina]|uniref:uncharacterized protein n=1 Tax=Haliotis asinina TaxID=109174 RepID=UPI0035328030
MPRLTAPERECAIGMLQNGASAREIARRLHCAHTTITRIHQRFLQTGSTRDRPRPGQQRVTTARQDRQIVRDHVRDRTLLATRTAAQVQGRSGFIHPNTGRNRLRAAGLRAQRPYFGPILTSTTDRHRTPLHICRGRVNAVYYRDQMLQNHVAPFFNQHHDVHKFQHNNARAHTARVSMQYLAQKNIPVLQWPAQSPDLSPIEHLWDEIGRRLSRRHQMDNIRELEVALVREWNAIPKNTTQRLINSDAPHVSMQMAVTPVIDFPTPIKPLSRINIIVNEI